MLLVDAVKRPKFSSKSEIKDLRQIAVNGSSRQLLADIGAWGEIAPRAWPCHRMRIGEAMGAGALEFTGKDGQPLNHITEAGLISKVQICEVHFLRKT